MEVREGWKVEEEEAPALVSHVALTPASRRRRTALSGRASRLARRPCAAPAAAMMAAASAPSVAVAEAAAAVAAAAQAASDV